MDDFAGGDEREDLAEAGAVEVAAADRPAAGRAWGRPGVDLFGRLVAAAVVCLVVGDVLEDEAFALGEWMLSR